MGKPTSALPRRVGQTVPVAGRAADGQDGTLPASALSWRLTLLHCVTPTSCHSHVVQDFPGVATGSLATPDHEYPPYLELTLPPPDSARNASSTTVRLDPLPVGLNFTPSPTQPLL